MPHPVPVPRWKSLLDAALAKFPDQTVVQLASTSTFPSTDAQLDLGGATGSAQPQPRVRSHVVRGFIDSLPYGIGGPPSFVANQLYTSDYEVLSIRQVTTPAAEPGAAKATSISAISTRSITSTDPSPAPPPTHSRRSSSSSLPLPSSPYTALLASQLDLQRARPTTYPLILSSTDVRTPKVMQFLSNPTTELAWWIEGAKQQFRIMGRVRAVPSPQWSLDSPFTPSKFSSLVDVLQQEQDQGGGGELEADAAALPPPAMAHRGSTSGFSSDSAGPPRHLRRAGSTGSSTSRSSRTRITPGQPSIENSPLMSPVEWHNAQSTWETTAYWEKKRVETFCEMSPFMKASWCRPIPGSPLAMHGGPEAAAKWPVKLENPEEEKEGETREEREKRRRDWEEALKNFALVVIEPFEVDFVDLSVVPNRRWRFWVEGGSGGQWKEEELVP